VPKKLVYYLLIVVFLFGVFRFLDYFFSVTLRQMIQESVIKYPPNSEFISTSTDFVYLSETNSLGIRNSELGEKTKPRILFFGDSFVYGVGVESEDTMIQILAKNFQNLNLNYELINAGVIGTCPKQAVELYSDIQDKINPDLIVLNIYTNDIYESGEDIIAKRSREHFVKQRKWIRLISLFFPRSVTIALRYYQKHYFPSVQSDIQSTVRLSHKYNREQKQKYRNPIPSKPIVESTLAQFLTQTEFMSHHIGIKSEDFLKWKEQVGRDILVDLATGRVSSVHGLLGLYDPEYYADSLDVPESQQENFETLLDSIEKFYKLSQKNHQKLILTYSPSELQYDRKKQNLNRKLGYHVKEEWLSNQSNLEKHLIDFSNRHRIPFLSLTDAFRKNAEKGLNWSFDIHWNEKGNQIAAEALFPFLKTELIGKE
jgi:hypothetical protein